MKEDEVIHETGIDGRPLIFKTVQELEDLIDGYFKSDDATIEIVSGDQVTKIKAPTMSGLALYLGLDRKTLYNYSKRAQFFPTIKKAKARVENFLEQRLYGNSVTGTIFSLKNNFDWADKTENTNTNVEVSQEEWLKSIK